MRRSASNSIQALAIRNGNKVIISFRGTSDQEDNNDWHANFGIGHATSFTTELPIIDGLVTEASSALANHGLTNEAALGNTTLLGRFARAANDARNAISSASSLAGCAAAAAVPFAAGVNGFCNATTPLMNNKKRILAGVGMCAAAAPFSAILAAAGSTAIASTVMATAFVATGNGLRHMAKTSLGMLTDSSNNDGTLEQRINKSSQRDLIFKISERFGHKYAQYIKDSVEFANDIIERLEDRDQLEITITGHSLGAHLATAALIALKSKHQDLDQVKLKGITFARPNGFLGISETLTAMRASPELIQLFEDKDKIREILAETKVFSHEHDIVAKIGCTSTGTGHTLAPEGEQYEEKGVKAINIHHSMDGILETLLKAFNPEAQQA